MFLVEVHLLDDGLHHRTRIALVVDGKLCGEAQIFALVAQDTGKDGVEGSHLQIAGTVASHEQSDTLFHLSGGLVGKREGEDVPRGEPLLKQIGNLVGEHFGFARTGTGNHQLRSFTIVDGFELSGRKSVVVHGLKSVFWGMNNLKRRDVRS